MDLSEGRGCRHHGGCAGIGVGHAEALAAEGAHMALIGRDGERAPARAAEIQAKYGVEAIRYRGRRVPCR